MVSQNPEPNSQNPLSYYPGMPRLRHAPLLAFLLTLAALGACRAGEPWVEMGGERFYVEIAADDGSRSRGLMFRDHLPADRGMLFVWRREEPRSFWMRNTRIALDIIYLDAEFRIVSMAPNAQPCRVRNCPSYPSGYPAQYVLEVQGGTAERLGVGRGDRLRVGNLPQP